MDIAAMSNPESPKKHVLHWFRKGLRLHDNPSLSEALTGATTYHCVYILDPRMDGVSHVEINRWRFLLQCLEDLDSSLRNFNSRLFVVRGQPAEVFPKLFKEWQITTLSFEEDPEPFGKERDSVIKALVQESGVDVLVRTSHTLYNPQKIISENNGTPPLTFQRFHSILAKLDPPARPQDPITTSIIDSAKTPTTEKHDAEYGVPTLEQLGFATSGLGATVFPGGESEALKRLDRYLERKALVSGFEKPKMTSKSLFPSEKTLSPYLRLGCLSPRLFYWKLNELYKRVEKKVDPAHALYGKLFWREFFYTVATNNPNFNRMSGNKNCVQIPWDKNPTAVAKWAEGITGFPWIDAIMKQLREVGWVHHLARQAVVCFLTRGDLWISWEEGLKVLYRKRKVFDLLLLDADWSENAGMWLWLSGSSFFQQLPNCHCPVDFGKQIDPAGDFIKHYLPLLKDIPPQYIYDPWNAPKRVQKAAKCIVATHYPIPMVNHTEASKRCMRRMKQVYKSLRKDL